MSRLAAFAEEDGWYLALHRAAVSLPRRLRDRVLSAQLRTQDFRCGHAPRILGLRHMHIGPHFRANDHLWLHAITSYEGQPHTPKLTIGAHVTFSDSVHIACLNSITIGDGALFGSRVIVSDHAHGSYNGPRQSAPELPPVQRPLASAGPITIGANVWLGDGVAVLAGAHIGAGCVIGANSVVTGTIPPHTIAVGTPARPIRRWDAVTSTWLPIPAPAVR